MSVVRKHGKGKDEHREIRHFLTMTKELKSIEGKGVKGYDRSGILPKKQADKDGKVQ